LSLPLFVFHNTKGGKEMRFAMLIILASFFAVLPLTYAIDDNVDFPDWTPSWTETPNLTEQAVVVLTFEEGSGDETTDLSGHGNNGLFSAGATWEDGKFGGGVGLGPSETVEAWRTVKIAPDESHAVHTMTVMGWFNYEGKIGNDSFLIDKSCWGCASELPRNFSLWDHHPGGNPSILSFGWRDNGDLGGGGDRTTGAADADYMHDGSWRHLAGTYDGQNVRAYIDGVELGVTGHPSDPNTANGPAATVSPITIGALYGAAPGGTGHGLTVGTRADEIVITTYALDGDDIQTIMDNGACSGPGMDVLGIDCAAAAVDQRDKLATTWGRLKE
jgi:hypothetical protein